VALDKQFNYLSMVVRVSFTISVEGGGANTTIAELRGGENYSNTSKIFISTE
jgi:hypothetical protein